jgi:phenol 2-monooxygenase
VLISIGKGEPFCLSIFFPPGMETEQTQQVADVLVIGAGPAGLMCATGLARAGLKIHIVDKRAHQVKVGHADGFQMRTLEVLQVGTTHHTFIVLIVEQSYGLLDHFLPLSNQVHLGVSNPTANKSLWTDKWRTQTEYVPTSRGGIQVRIHICGKATSTYTSQS